jgi:hypothetical protein
MIHNICVTVGVAAAIGLAAVGVLRGTYAAGGSDSSCYALMAEAFASGQIQPTSALATKVPWPHASRTFTPGGFLPSHNDPAASSPICAPGFSLLLAPLVLIGGLNALFWLTPVAGALLVWMTFVAARELGGPLVGAMAAVLIAVSPPVLYQVVQPMNDIMTAALWMAVFVALVQRRWDIGGVCCGLALLVRPNLLPLAAVAGAFVLVAEPIPNPQSLIPRTFRFCLAVLPFALLIVWLNAELYGGALRTGYGELGNLFGFSNIVINAPRYARWLIETHTVFPLLAIAAPVVVSREKRAAVLLAIGLIAATLVIYVAYQPFDDWTYLRFLLPAIALMVALACAATVNLLKYSARMTPRVVIAAAVTAAIALFCVRTADQRQAFALRFLEQRYRSAGAVVRDRLPSDAVVLAVWDSGSVRFHGRKEALSWEALDPGWFDRSLTWLEQHGRRPYIMLETWEESGFRDRFGVVSDIGKLDWPPKYEIDRFVRIYDPRDRARYLRGERVGPEYLWPLRR